MDKGTNVGWRSALMAPVCFVIRSSVKRRRGGGQSTGKEKEDRKRTDIQTDRIEPVKERGRKKVRKEEIRGQLRESWRG